MDLAKGKVDEVEVPHCVVGIRVWLVTVCGQFPENRVISGRLPGVPHPVFSLSDKALPQSGPCERPTKRNAVALVGASL
jgi:hypothetical protein